MMQWSDFLNPRSMMTPGVAGSLVMVIANTLYVQFMLPQKWTALILSFVLIVPILLQFSASWLESIVYFCINGLIIFSLAVNANVAGGKLQELAAPLPASVPAPSRAEATNLNSSVSLAFSDHATMSGTQLQLAQNDEKEKEKKQGSSQNGNRSDDKKDKKGQKDKPEFFQQWF